MEISGKVIAVCEKKSGTTANGEWTSQDFVIETDGQYPKKVCLNCYKKPTPNVGDTVKVFFDPESREYNGNWFTTLRVWKFEAEQSAPIQQTQSTVQPTDDVPF
jgi:hypothetical protein